jgi:hypothetical protein
MRGRVAAFGLAVLGLLLSEGCATDQSSGGWATGWTAGGDRGFVTIFDGRSLDGWEIVVEPGDQPEKKLRQDAFYLENGTLACKGYGFHWFRYKEPLQDCVLRMEFKIAKDTNSGVCLRSLKKGTPPTTGFEVQIVDDIGKEPSKYSTGAIYDVVTPMYNASKPIGEWNEMEITMKGSLVVVVLNGLKLIDTDFSKLTRPIGKFDFAYANMPRSGYLALQDHWTPIWYRNIRLKKL